MLGQHCSMQHKVLEAADDEAALTGAIIDWARQYGRFEPWYIDQPLIPGTLPNCLSATLSLGEI